MNGKDWKKGGAPIEFGPAGPVPPSLQPFFERHSGKPHTDMTNGEKRAAAAAFLSQHFKENDGTDG